MNKKRLAILGVSGSIGGTTLDIIRRYGSLFSVSLICNYENTVALHRIMREFSPHIAVCVKSKELYVDGMAVNFDERILERPETYENIDIVVNGIVGLAGLAPGLAALLAGKTLATANKESIVAAGKIINSVKNANNAKIIPLDSEHSTIFQCIGKRSADVEEIILTASGGAFRDYSYEQLCAATATNALCHPNWKMGKKVTVDCATLMNKGMEIIEAKHLFGINKISVLQHRESIVHSLVRMKDNAVIAGLSVPDMTVPIQYALTYPKRMNTNVCALDLCEVASLHFSDLDEKRFPCLALAKKACSMGDVAACVMNAANEIAVAMFLQGKTTFYGISDMVENAMQEFAQDGDFLNTDEVFRMDKEVREYTGRSGVSI